LAPGLPGNVGERQRGSTALGHLPKEFPNRPRIGFQESLEHHFIIKPPEAIEEPSLRHGPKQEERKR
jgi:hypothetical protein